MLLDLGVHLEPFFHELWRHLILCQVVRHTYQHPTEEVKRSLFARLRRDQAANPKAAKRLASIDKLEADFWTDLEELTHEQIDTLVESIGAEAGLNAPGLPISLGGHGERTTTSETRVQLREKFQRVVNDQVVFQLRALVTELAESTLESEQHFTYLVVDDLDLTWVEDSLANVLIKCLLQVALEMQPTRHLKILIALRTNVFEQLEVGREARGGQEEKLRSTAMILHWTHRDLEDLVNLRLAAESQRLHLPATLSLGNLLPGSSQHGIQPFRYILNRTLMRPRDVIQYLNDCLDLCATERPRITWNLIKAVEPAYSRNRLEALRDEWKDPYYDIDRVFELFRGRPWSFDVATLYDVSENAALLLSEFAPSSEAAPFQGTAWLTPLCQRIWAAGAYRLSHLEQVRPLCELLFYIGFLGFASRPRQEATYQYEPSDDFDEIYDSLGDDAECSVHPAFRLALRMVAPGGGSD